MDPIDTFIQRFMHGTTGMRGCNYCVQSSPDSLFSWFDDCGSVLKHEYTFNTFLECIKKTRDFLIPHGDFMIVRTSKHLAPYAAYYITRIEDVIRVGTSDPYKMLWIAFDCEPRETNLYFVYQDQFPGFRIDGHVEHALEQQEAYFVPVGAESGIRSYVEKMNEYTSLHVSNKLKDHPDINVRWRHLMLNPLSHFLRMFISRKGYKDGFHGFVLALLDATYAMVMYAKLWEYRMRQAEGKGQLPPITNAELNILKRKA